MVKQIMVLRDACCLGVGGDSLEIHIKRKISIEIMGIIGRANGKVVAWQCSGPRSYIYMILTKMPLTKISTLHVDIYH